MAGVDVEADMSGLFVGEEQLRMVFFFFPFKDASLTLLANHPNVVQIYKDLSGLGRDLGSVLNMRPGIQGSLSEVWERRKGAFLYPI